MTHLWLKLIFCVKDLVGRPCLQWRSSFTTRNKPSLVNSTWKSTLTIGKKNAWVRIFFSVISAPLIGLSTSRGQNYSRFQLKTKIPLFNSLKTKGHNPFHEENLNISTNILKYKSGRGGGECWCGFQLLKRECVKTYIFILFTCAPFSILKELKLKKVERVVAYKIIIKLK